MIRRFCTQNDLRRLAIKMGLQAGVKVSIEYRAYLKDLSLVVRSRESGIVEALYSCYFVCRVRGHQECFRYNELIGEETTKVRLIP